MPGLQQSCAATSGHRLVTEFPDWDKNLRIFVLWGTPVPSFYVTTVFNKGVCKKGGRGGNDETGF